MKPPETVYRGQRLIGGRGEVLGVRVTVTTPDGHERLLSPQQARQCRDLAEGFEWGYPGSGAALLAFALILDATGDRQQAEDAHQWFKWATVLVWDDEWSITVGEVLGWLGQWQCEGGCEDRGYRRDVVIATEEGGAR